MFFLIVLHRLLIAFTIGFSCRTWHCIEKRKLSRLVKETTASATLTCAPVLIIALVQVQVNVIMHVGPFFRQTLIGWVSVSILTWSTSL